MCDRWREWSNPINGHIIKALFHLDDGPILGTLREKIKEEIYCVPEKENFDYALAYLKKIAPDYGLQPDPTISDEELRKLVHQPKDKEKN